MPSNSTYKTSAPESHPSTCPASSNASTASTKPAPANPAAQVSAWPSSSTSSWRTAEQSAQKANSITAQHFSSPSHGPDCAIRIVWRGRPPKKTEHANHDALFCDLPRKVESHEALPDAPPAPVASPPPPRPNHPISRHDPNRKVRLRHR